MTGPTQSASHGFVLAGGHSLRMGRNKALLPLGDSPLLRVLAARVRQAAHRVAIIAPPDVYESLSFEVIPDLQPGCGPLGGIETALALQRADYNLVVACDMPNLSVSFLESLLAAAHRSTADCVLPTFPDGREEPLCAVYRTSCLARIREALAAGQRKVTSALKNLQVLHFTIQNKEEMVNLNSPEDWLAFLESQRG